MPAPDTPSRRLPRLHVLLAVAFLIGVLLFLLVWWNSRQTYDFYRAAPTPASPGTSPSDTLPAPQPPDLTSDRTISGLQVIPGAATPPVPSPPPPPAPSAASADPSSPQATPATEPQDSTPPEPLSTPAPVYPPDALRMGAGGTVQVRITVGSDGQVVQRELAESSGNRALDRAALEAVQRWRFRPALRNGQPVSTDVVIPIRFAPQE